MKGSFRINESLTANGFFLISQYNTNGDALDFSGADLPFRNNLIVGKAELAGRFLSGALTAKIGYSYAGTFSELSSDPRRFPSLLLTSTVRTSRQVIYARGSYRFATAWPFAIRHRVGFLYEYQHERSQLKLESGSPIFGFDNKINDTRNTVSGEYGVAIANRLFLTGSARFDSAATVERGYVLRGDAAYHIRRFGTKLVALAEWGATPFSRSFFFAPNLRPAPLRSTHWEAGLEQSLFGRQLTAGARYFMGRFFDAETGIGVSDRSTRFNGAEMRLDARIGKRFKGGISYSYFRAENSDLGEIKDLQRHMIAAHGRLALFGGRGQIYGLLNYTPSIRRPFGFNGDRNKMFYVRVAASYRVRPAITLFTRVENLFNENLTSGFLGQNSRGVMAFGGVKIDIARLMGWKTEKANK